MQTFSSFGAAARDLARNPLGIIALFIVLIYGFASLVFGFSERVSSSDRSILVWFLVLFPPLVLLAFAWLVSRHHTKLYAPSDYRDDANFIEASRRQVEVAVALGAAATQGRNVDPPTDEALQRTVEAADLALQTVHDRMRDGDGRRRVLWVDDQPRNNAFIRRALEALDIDVVNSVSTDHALPLLRGQDWDAVISDMGRPPDPRAGYTLLEGARKVGYKGPFFIFAIEGSAPEHRAEAQRRGAQGSTDHADELVRMLVEAVGTSTKRRVSRPF